jgi:predicted 3-demethylubiquinone-9 3-methyltransferase (glyoxalase superfamily)
MVMIVRFELEGQLFMALNGGPIFKFSPAISFLVNCDTQEEVDDLWKRLSEDGKEDQCGWLRDKFGVSWQIVPNVLGEMIQDKDTMKCESHTCNASDEENRHTAIEDGIRGAIEERP